MECTTSPVATARCRLLGELPAAYPEPWRSWRAPDVEDRVDERPCSFNAVGASRTEWRRREAIIDERRVCASHGFTEAFALTEISRDVAMLISVPGRFAPNETEIPSSG